MGGGGLTKVEVTSQPPEEFEEIKNNVSISSIMRVVAVNTKVCGRSSLNY